MGLKVCKFGGTSLASAAQIRRVCTIILADGDRRIVAVSAPGKNSPTDTKVTDMLIDCAQAKLSGADFRTPAAQVARRFGSIAQELGLSDEMAQEAQAALLGRLMQVSTHRERFIDSVKALGEELCARLVTHFLQHEGVTASFIDPKEVGLLLTDEAGKARVLAETYQNLAHLDARPGIKIVPGFYGFTKTGELVTFPRGGSDITGAVLAAAVGADLYENFTDVDNVLAAHPNLVEAPLAIEELTYGEMRELAYSGFGVFHDEALEPVYRAGISVRIANTNNPSAPGTRIVAHKAPSPRPVIGVAANTNFCTISIGKYLMNRQMGLGRRVLQIIEEAGLSYEHSPSGIDTLSIILRESGFDAATEEHVLERIKREIAPDTITVERGLALIMVVGEGMRSTVGMAARATTALARAGVNIEMMNQGASEISMMFGIRGQDTKAAVNALYSEFFGTSPC